MDLSGLNDQLGPRELVGRIAESLLMLFRTLSAANSDISIYCYYHAVEDIRRDLHAWKKLDEAYLMFEEQANNCRRLWMRLRATAEKAVPLINSASETSSAPELHLLGRSPSPLEYQSEPGEGEPTKAVDQFTPMDLDPVEAERGNRRPPPTPVADPPPQLKRKVHRPPASIKLALNSIVCPRKMPLPLHNRSV